MKNYMEKRKKKKSSQDQSLKVYEKNKRDKNRQ